MYRSETSVVKTTTHVRRETDSLDDISPLLEGRVFHVTKLTHFDAILTEGAIKANGNGALPTTFGYTGAFFRKRNCVSLFDYRLEPTDQIRDFRMRCPPFQPARPDSDGIAILILKPEVDLALIPWTRWKEENALRDMVVPYVEAGYPGSISIDLIDEVICLKIEEDPKSLSAKLRKLRRAAS